jgi:hypothetical protein
MAGEEAGDGEDLTLKGGEPTEQGAKQKQKLSTVVRPKYLDSSLKAVDSEVLFALDKWGDFASYHEGYAVLLEEVDELWEEIKGKLRSDSTVIFEATQVAAMAIKMMMFAERQKHK